MSRTSVCYYYMTTDVRDEMHALSMFPRAMQPKVFVNDYSASSVVETRFLWDQEHNDLVASYKVGLNASRLFISDTFSFGLEVFCHS